MSHLTDLKNFRGMLPGALSLELRGETVDALFQFVLRNGTELLRRSALLLALTVVVFCQPAPGEILRKGMLVATNFSGFINNVPNAADPNGHVIAIIDVRNKNSAGIKPGTNWSSDPTYPGRIRQVKGACVP